MHPSPCSVVVALCALAVVFAPVPTPAAAQSWNDPAAVALAKRAVARRDEAFADTGLRDYRARAHGFVFFLGQFGEGMAQAPRLVKADQLELEVYWKAPRLSKQRIVGWRDRAELPSDISYHVDHLGIIQNNFGPVIRLGDGDEVRDVPHPLSAGAMVRYDYALGDTTTILLGDRKVRVATLHVRPASPAPAIAGTLYLDVATADLVRMAFSFTPSSYVDDQLEDVSIVLESSLWEGRFWLPYRQEIEIRRRATWLDIPARGVIRTRWDIEDYDFNIGLDDMWFAGPEIVALSRSERERYPWDTTLAAAIQGVAEPVRRNDMEAVRAEVTRLAGDRARSALQPTRLGVRRISDLIRANRVEGLVLGAGFVLRLTESVESRALMSYGLADDWAKGLFALNNAFGLWHVEVAVYREVRDVADYPVVSTLINSFAAQEFGNDFGDYYGAEGVRLAVTRSLGARSEASLTLERNAIRSLTVHGEPASGTYRPNPALGGLSNNRAMLSLRRRSGGFAVRRDVQAEFTLEAGGPNDGITYGRVALAGQAIMPLGGTRVLVRGEGGYASAEQPAHRTFVMGGRGTLLGDPFRAWGGTRAALLHAEWRLPLPSLTLGIASVARVPTTLTLAPFVAAGWTDVPPDGMTWSATGDPRLSVGVALEWLGVIRLEFGYGTSSREAQVSFDLSRDFWPIL
jgi:hypothetical protein